MRAGKEEECWRRERSNGEPHRKWKVYDGDRSGSENLGNQEQDREEEGKERKGNER